MTLLTIVQDAADAIGLPQPASVVANTDQTARTLLALANREGQNLAKMRNTWGGGWSILEIEHTFVTTATNEYDFPVDYVEMLGGTQWDRSSFWAMRGPVSPQMWQSSVSGLAETPALRLRWRIKRSTTSGEKKFFLDPDPVVGETLVFEYLTKNWVADAMGTTFRTKFEADDDTSLLDEDLIEMGLIWRYKASKGLSFAAELGEYEIERDKRLGNDGGTRAIEIGRRRFRLPPANVPDTGFGV